MGYFWKVIPPMSFFKNSGIGAGVGSPWL